MHEEDPCKVEVPTPHLSEVAPSNPNTSPVPSADCCTTIPPSPSAFEPEAKRINLSVTSRLVVCWKDAVPTTVRSFCTTKSLFTCRSF